MENGTGMVKVESGVGQAKIHLKTKTVVVTCLLQRKKRRLHWIVEEEGNGKKEK